MPRKVTVGDEWDGGRKRQAEVMHDRVDVEEVVDAREELRDEAWLYLEATSECAKSASAEWVVLESGGGSFGGGNGAVVSRAGSEG